MALETYTGFWKDLIVTNPTPLDNISQGDDHIRGIKFSMVEQWPGLTEGIPITVSESELNALPGIVELSRRATGNLLDNTSFLINDRNFTPPYQVGEYGYNRWKGHANGKEQIVAERDIEPGNDYTLSWTGGGTGSINGSVPAASPVTVNVPASGTVSAVIPADATEPVLVKGSLPGAWSVRRRALDELFCQEYFFQTNGNGMRVANGVIASTAQAQFVIQFPTKMISSPGFSAGGTWTNRTGGVTWSMSLLGINEQVAFIGGDSSGHGIAIGQGDLLRADDAGAYLRFDAEP